MKSNSKINFKSWLTNEPVYIDKDLSDAYDRLSNLRAKQLTGMCNNNEYLHTKNYVIQKSHPITQSFWHELESNFTVEICILFYIGKGVYQIKIRTKEGTYFDVATPNEIRQKLNKIEINKRSSTLINKSKNTIGNMTVNSEDTKLFNETRIF